MKKKILVNFEKVQDQNFRDKYNKGSFFSGEGTSNNEQPFVLGPTYDILDFFSLTKPCGITVVGNIALYRVWRLVLENSAQRSRDFEATEKKW